MPSISEVLAGIARVRAEREARAAAFAKSREAKAKFRSSMAWRRTRYRVLAESAARNGGKPRCEICGRGADDGVRLEVDHIEPLSVNWERRLDPANLRVACADCNGGRLNRPIAGL